MFLNPSNDRKPTINPTNSAPLSPKKIFAGWKLKNKNPKSAPINTLHIIIINILACNIAIKPIVISAIIETPDARPSNPSIKFIAFVMATIQMTVIGIPNIPKCIVGPIGNEIKSIVTPSVSYTHLTLPTKA